MNPYATKENVIWYLHGYKSARMALEIQVLPSFDSNIHRWYGLVSVSWTE